VELAVITFKNDILLICQPLFQRTGAVLRSFQRYIKERDEINHMGRGETGDRKYALASGRELQHPD
jgi:hypothetical protein